MKCAYSVVHAGLSSPVRLFHLTDMHITRSSEQDHPYVQRQQAERRLIFCPAGQKTSEALLDDYLLESENSDCLIMTGDMIDAPSDGNLAYLSEKLAGRNCLYVTGNHDWRFPSDHPAGAEGQKAFRSLLERASGFPIDFCTLKVGELTLIGLDNSQYQVSKEQAERVLATLKQGEPTVLCCHIPFYCETLWESVRDYWDMPLLVGCPDEALRQSFVDASSIRPQAETAMFVERLKTFPNLVAILAGHVHFNHEDRFSEYTVQIVTQTAVHDPIQERFGRTVPHQPGTARWVELL